MADQHVEVDLPRFFIAAEAAREYAGQLADDLDDPDHVAARYDAVTRVINNIGSLAHTYDFAVGHPDLSSAELTGQIGGQLRAAIEAEEVPAGVRDIYLHYYGAELPPYDDVEVV